jgi:hypothetical protein
MESFGLDPGRESAAPLCCVRNEYQTGWQFTLLPVNVLEDFIDRWGGWLAQASTGAMSRQSNKADPMPTGTWRRR